MSDIWLVDSTSDGMCGSVTVRDSETQEEETVRWSISNKLIGTPSEAKEVATQRLIERLNTDPYSYEPDEGRLKGIDL
jgi:hypothetical protein